MHILAVIDGRPGGVSELLAKQALLGAKEAGADQLTLVNVRDLDIKPCVNCNACHNPFTAAVGNCHLKDDLKWMDERIMESDGMIVVMPCYEKAPPGEFKLLMDRTGPSHDPAFRYMAKKKRAEEPEKYNSDVVDERSFRKRFVSFIAHGGSEWTQLCLPTMMGWAVSLGLTPVDKLLYQWNVGIAFDDERLARAKESGRYVAQCCAAPDQDHPFLGDPGLCPECHNDVMVVDPKTGEAECSVCGLKGKLRSTPEGGLHLECTDEALERSHMRMSGHMIHYYDILNNISRVMKTDRAEAKRRTDPILQWISASKPESDL